eukprot:238029-Chlamydomonas_euryale.AAC.7
MPALLCATSSCGRACAMPACVYVARFFLMTVRDGAWLGAWQPCDFVIEWTRNRMGYVTLPRVSDGRCSEEERPF